MLRKQSNLTGRLLIAVLAFLCSIGAGAVTPKTEAQKLISGISRKEPLRSGVWGVLAVRMDGDTVACYNHVQKMVPASNVKLLTTGLALRTLGPDFRFETSLGYSGEVRDSVLFGDLYIIGGGDPTTGSKSDCAEETSSLFARWHRLIRQAGIKSIEGRIIADPRFFSGTPEGMGWSYEDIGTDYGAGPTGLNFFENVQNFRVTPGVVQGARPYVNVAYPDTPWMSYINSAVTGAPKTPNGLFYINTEFGPYGEIRGSYPIDRSRGTTLMCSNRFGAFTCAYYFYNYLSRNGIRAAKGYADVSPLGFVRSDLHFCDAGVRAEKQEDLKRIGSTRSPALSDIIRDTNCESDNFFAETLFHMLGKTAYGTSSYDTCYVAAKDAFLALGLNPQDACRMFDGSGLSRKNYVSPDFFVRYLRAMARSSVAAPFIASLPQPGGKGTLEFRMKTSTQEMKDRIHMKSGSMNGVLCFSGYIDASDGDPSHNIVFSLMTNNVTASAYSVGLLLERMILALAAEN